uniref:Endonuclease/exonuclease/phosphatase domain-containing protein n=1 Tax=Aegilops tauschii subsp. strangulata TaxID=200361 RepID=A0A453L078_AEGTS
MVRPAIVCLQETKVEHLTVDIVRHCPGINLENYFYLPATGTRGGILLAWDETIVGLSNPHPTMNTITALVKPKNGGHWWFTCVYGPQTDMDKVAFMQELVDVRELHAGPWAIMGDFNLLVSPQDKNNDVINRRMIARFRNKANQLEVKEMYLNGRKFTWSNERQRPTMEKIDHVFTTNCWDDAYPAALLTAMGSAVSDHCPLLLDINAYFAYGKRFRFESF